MKPNPIAAAISNVFKPGVTPSAETNTPVVLASQREPEPRPNHGDKEGDGKLPESITFKSDRHRTLKEIAERRNAQAVEEGNETVPNDDDAETNAPAPEAEGADLDAAPQEQTQEGSLPTAAAPPPAVAAPEETREIIVDGRTVQVPVSKILETGTRALQKDFAADLRLNQATQILEEAKRVATQPAQQQPAAEPSIADMSDDQLAELIQFGTKEQAASAIKALRSSGQPALKPEEIVRAAQQAVAPAIAFEQGKSFAQSEYGDILKDPDLGAVFLMRENALRKAGDQRGYNELYKAIGDDMRVKFNRPKPGGTALPAAAPSTQGRTMAEKQAAKAQAPAAPRLASARLDGEGTQPRPATNAEIIAKQRAARGFSQGKNY